MVPILFLRNTTWVTGPATTLYDSNRSVLQSNRLFSIRSRASKFLMWMNLALEVSSFIFFCRLVLLTFWVSKGVPPNFCRLWFSRCVNADTERRCFSSSSPLSRGLRYCLFSLPAFFLEVVLACVDRLRLWSNFLCVWTLFKPGRLFGFALSIFADYAIDLYNAVTVLLGVVASFSPDG